jgi:hypothetical protein
MSRTALELIGQSGFGYSFDGLKEDSVPIPLLPVSSVLSELVVICLTVLDINIPPKWAVKGLVFARLYLLPTLSRIGTPQIPELRGEAPAMEIHTRNRGASGCMHNTSVEIIKSRKMALEEGKEAMDRQVGRGKDIISILCEILLLLSFTSSTDATTVQANEQAETQDRLSDEEVLAQIS